MSTVRSSAVLASLIALVSFEAALADDKASEASERIAARTVYLQYPIEEFRRFTVFGKLGGPGTLILDPNTCAVNDFGDTGACTRIAPVVASVVLKDTMKPDPAGLGRKLYLVEGAGLRNPLFLMSDPGGGRPPRLIYNNRGPDAPRPITLEPLVYSDKRDQKDKKTDPATVELCEAAKYWAQQVPGKVIIYAVGVHPTSGYDTFFEQSPIDIFPPQFRLMHITPSGIVLPVITPFLVHTSFPAKDPIKEVTVHDAKGSHKVPVEQVPDVK